jgi:hypothetical protein
MSHILRIGWIDPRRVSDALSICGHDSGHKGQNCTYDPSHDITRGINARCELASSCGDDVAFCRLTEIGAASIAPWRGNTIHWYRNGHTPAIVPYLGIVADRRELSAATGQPMEAIYTFAISKVGRANSSSTAGFLSINPCS